MQGCIASQSLLLVPCLGSKSFRILLTPFAEHNTTYEPID